MQSRVATSQSSKAAGQAEGLKHYSPGDARSPRLRHPGTQALPGRASLPWLDRRHPQSLSHWPSRPSSAVNPRPDKVLRPPNRPAGKRSATNPLPPPRRVNFGSRLTVRGFVVSIRNPWSPGRPHSAISLLLHRSPSGRNRIVPPSPPLRPFDPGAPGLRAGRSLRAGLRALCGELPCRLPSRLFPRFPPFSAVSASSALGEKGDMLLFQEEKGKKGTCYFFSVLWVPLASVRRLPLPYFHPSLRPLCSLR